MRDIINEQQRCAFTVYCFFATSEEDLSDSVKVLKKQKKELYGLITGENVNHHKIYNIYAENNMFFYVSRETLCGRIRIKVL